MINVSQQQLDKFWSSDNEEFITLVQQEIVEDVSWVSKAWPSEIINEKVIYAVDRAIANGFDDDVSIRTFVNMMFIIGPDFDQHPEIHRVLSDTTLTADEKWDKLGEDPFYAPIWKELSTPDHQDYWNQEGWGDICTAYPTTYMLPGFVALYDKVRRERYPMLVPGESLRDD